MLLETLRGHSSDGERRLLCSTKRKHHGAYFSPVPEAQLSLSTALNKVTKISLGLCWVCTLLRLSPAARCSLRHLVLLQRLGKRKIAVCIFKQTIKITSTMYWHRRVCSVTHTFPGSVRLLLCTANSISSPVLSRVLLTALFISASLFLRQEAPTLGQILQNTSVFCRREVHSAVMDLEKTGPR